MYRVWFFAPYFHQWLLLNGKELPPQEARRVRRLTREIGYCTALERIA